MATSRNLRYCQVYHDSVYYDVMIAVNNLDEVNDILQEWALTSDGPGEALDLPSELVKNQDITDAWTTKDINSFVYVKSASTGYMDTVQYAGLSTFPTLPTILVSTKYIIPSCTANLWSTASFSGIFSSYTIPQAEFTLVDGQVNFFGIDYSSGTPVYTQYTDATSFNYSSIIPVCATIYFNSAILNIPFGSAGVSLPEKLLLNQYKRKNYDIVSDFTLDNSTTYVELGALTVNNGVQDVSCLAFNSATAENDLWLYYKDSSSIWQKTQADTIDNANYQGAGTGLQTLTDAYYNINYLYRMIDSTEKVMINILSTQYETLAEAKEADMITDLPDIVKEGCVLVGRFIVQKSSDAPVVQKIQRVQPFATVS